EYAHIACAGCVKLAQQAAHATAVNLDANEVLLRVVGGEVSQHFAGTEADFQRAWCRAAELGIPVHGGVRWRQAVARPQLIQVFLLPCGQAPFAAHETADSPLSVVHDIGGLLPASKAG